MTKKQKTWDDVKRKCKLDDETIRMAKELGMKPRTVLGSHASRRDEPWKSPVGEWIRDLHEKRFKKEGG